MPFKRKFKRSRFKRRTSSRKFGRRSYRRRRLIPSLVSNRFGGFPQSKLVKLRYNQHVDLAPVGPGVLSKYVFRCNGPYDPDQSGIGHQPMGYDAWSAIYGRYVVVGAKIGVRMTQMHAEMEPIGAAELPMVAGITVDDDASFLSTASEAIERGTSTFRHFVNLNANGKSISMTKAWSAKKWFHVANIKDVETMGSAVDSLPSRQAFFIIWVGPTDANSEYLDTELEVTIEYLVLFTQPKDQSANLGKPASKPSHDTKPQLISASAPTQPPAQPPTHDRRVPPYTHK